MVLFCGVAGNSFAQDTDTTHVILQNGEPTPAAVAPVLIGGMEGLNERLVYPEEARKRGIEGRVLLEFLVHEDGSVSEIEVLRSPDSLLSAVAIKALEESRFEPGMHNGRPVRVRHGLPVTFRLTPEPPSPPAPEPIGGMADLNDRLVCPDSLQNENIAGDVSLRFRLQEDGSLAEISVRETPDERLNASLMDVLRRSRWDWGEAEGEATVQVTFFVSCGE